jgi:multiple sugar transport system substrate-binding protein
MWIAGVSTSAPNKANAIKFLKWFTSNRIQVEMVRAGSTPVTVPAFNDPVAQSKSLWLPVAAKQIALGLGSKPRTPDWSKVEELLSIQLNKALQRKSLGNALDVAATQVTAYLKKQGYYS